MKEFLVVDRVSFAYNGVPVLRGIGFTAARGEFLAVAGPNGAGKTTLLRLLGGTLTPLAGEIKLAGVSLRRLNARERARRIGVVGQETYLDFPFSVGEVVLMGRYPYLSRFGHEGPEDLAAARRAMGAARVAHLRDRPVTTLSGGERQRVLLARALAQEPEVLLLDEPVAHLDINHQTAIMDLLRGLTRERGITVVAAMHDLNLTALYADRVLLLAGGTVAASGIPEEVLTPETMQRVYRSEVLTVRHPRTGCPQIMLIPGGNETPCGPGH